MRKGLLFALMMASSMLSFGQSDISNKLSISTKMFIDERDGAIEMKRNTDAEKRLGLEFVGKRKKANKNDGRFYAAPDTINGKAYISCFIRMESTAGVKSLISKGVQIQCKFDNGLYTALVPVERIEEVAAVTGVKRVNVATLMRPLTNNARTATNVDDALTKSADAVALGLSSKYDGSGVVLGVIDTGIDFQHIAFKDADGNSRIKRAYVYNGSSAKEYTSISSSSPTTDDSSEDHGTHTSSTAGGSSVIINGSSVTVTDDHANATYGGMAPGADLYLAGINGLSSTYLANAFQKICNYADGVDKPVVVSNSWGSQYGPHDGTGDFADITAQYFGDSHPNHICLFAASNDAGKSKDNEGGGYHIQGTASSSSPLGSILRSASYSNTDAGYYYYGIIANAWSRSTSTSSLACKILVLDSSTGAVKTSVTVTPSTSGATVSGLSSYFSGTLYAYKDYVSSNKTQLMLYTSGLTSRSYSKTTKNGSTYYTSNYTLAVQFYPTSGSCTIDAWGGSYSYYTDYLTTSGYTWTDGSDNSSVSDEATDPNVIAIGAYVTKNSVTDYSGSSHDLSDTYTLGDIAYFSSYQEEGVGATGEMIPWISAPGATLASAVNHYHTSDGYIDNAYADYGMYRVNSNTTYPYGTMEGTSMATPAAAGIVALWLQAAVEAGKELTVDDVKDIMKETAITDAYTSGTNGSHFGNGKIDALAGIQSILGSTAGSVTTTPVITASATSLAFSGTVGETYTKTFTVTGTDLEGAISASISGSSNYTVSPSSISASAAAKGATVTVTYAPTASGSTEATLTLTSSNAESVSIALSGTAEVATTPVISASASSLAFSGTVGQTYTKTITVTGTDLEGAITVTKSGSSVYSVSASSISASAAASGATLTVTYAPTAAGTTSATITLSSSNAQSVTISVSGTAEEATVPVISASASSLAFSATAGSTETKSLTVSGTDLEGSIAVAVSGTGFSVNTSSISSSAAASGKAINVTFTAPATAGQYTGTLTLTSSNASTVTVALTGTSTAASSGEETTTMEVYKLVSSISSGKNYIIANRNAAGSANALSNSSSRSITNASVTIVSGTDADGNAITYITEPSSYAVWTTSTSGSYYRFKNNGYYLYHSNSRLSMSSSTSKSNWYVGSNATTVYYSSGSSYRYLTYGSSWGLSSSSSKVYFYEKTTIEVAGSGDDEEEEVVPDPVLSVDDSSLSFETVVGSAVSQTFTVTGTDLTESVSVSLSDANGVYSVSPSTISATAAEAGATVTVTFDPAAAGSYSGTVTLTSGSASARVSLSASATAPAEEEEEEEDESEPDGGTASDSYLNLHKYTTIDDAGYSGVNNFYVYSKESDGSAWLTLSAYGAASSSSYQGWISYSSNSTVRTSWSATDVFNGSSAYFTSSSSWWGGSSSYAVTTSSYSSSSATQTYYVTNLKALKVYGYNPSSSYSWWGGSSSSNASTTVNVYECTVSSNGSVTASSSAAATSSYSTSGSSFIINIDNLDGDKVYKVEVTFKKSYIYEVAFQTTQSSWATTSDFGDFGTVDISTMNADESEVKIFSIDGAYVGSDVKALEKGMYIIDGKKVMIGK
jgi:hypothetical protein